MVICRSQPRKVKFNTPKPDYSKEEDIIDYEIVEYVEKTGEGENDFIVKKKVVEASRKNRQAFYDEQAKGHSIYEIIDKVLLTGDSSLLLKPDSGIYGDFSKLPLDRADAAANHQAVLEALSKLDPELVGKDLFAFLKDVTQEDIDKFYAEKAAKANAAKEEKVGGAE